MERGAVFVDDAKPTEKAKAESLDIQDLEQNNNGLETYYTPDNVNYQQNTRPQQKGSNGKLIPPMKAQLKNNPFKAVFNGIKQEWGAKPESLTIQGIGQNDDIRMTDNVDDKKTDDEIGICAYSQCSNTFIKTVPWKKFCCDDHRKLNHEEKTGKALPEHIRRGAL